MIFTTPTGSRLSYETDPRPGFEGQTITASTEPAVQAWLNERYPVPGPDRQQVTDHAEHLIEQGVTLSITGVTEAVYVQGRDKDTRNVQGLVTAASLRLGAGDTTTLTPFRDGNNITHQLVPAQVIEMWQKSAAYVSAVYAASWAIKDGTIAADFHSDARWPATDQSGA